MDAVRKVLDELESGSLVDQLKEKGALVPWASAKLMSPLPRPTLILAGGRAYRKHLIDQQNIRLQLGEN